MSFFLKFVSQGLWKGHWYPDTYCVDTKVSILKIYVLINRELFFQICDSEDTFLSCSFVIHIEISFIFWYTDLFWILLYHHLLRLTLDFF